MKCIIIDDEPLAIDVIESYLLKIDHMEIVAKCNNSLDAISLINRHQIDLVFLDIEMPNLTGIDLVKTIHNIPQFIFTTAYPQYALEGFNLNATDYLVKPIPFQRFLQAISKARDKFEMESKNSSSPEPISTIAPVAPVANDFIFVKSEYENLKIEVSDIMYLQGLKDYIKIYTKGSKKAILTLSSFKEILSKLPYCFLRVHRSFIVNINYIKALQKTKVLVADVQIPIGETYKKVVLERLGL